MVEMTKLASSEKLRLLRIANAIVSRDRDALDRLLDESLADFDEICNLLDSVPFDIGTQSLAMIDDAEISEAPAGLCIDASFQSTSGTETPVVLMVDILTDKSPRRFILKGVSY